MVEAPIHGVVRILRSGVTNTPVNVQDYEDTRSAIAKEPGVRKSLRRVLVGPNATRQEGKALADAIRLARDFVALTQDPSLITSDRIDAAIASMNILLTAGSHHEAYDTIAAQLVSRANPDLFSRDPAGGAARTVYRIASVLKLQEQAMQTMSLGLKGLAREVKGQTGGSQAALDEIQRLMKEAKSVDDEGGKGAVERFFQRHTLNEDDKA